MKVEYELSVSELKAIIEFICMKLREKNHVKIK